VDSRADLYSLGGTFYYVLAGQPPFPGGSPLDKIIAHLDQPPPPVQGARPDVPDSLARIVARLLAKDAADRFATAGVLAEALAPFTALPATEAPLETPEPPVTTAAHYQMIPNSKSAAAPPKTLDRKRRTSPEKRESDSQTAPAPNRIFRLVGLTAALALAIGVLVLVLNVALSR